MKFVFSLFSFFNKQLNDRFKWLMLIVVIRGFIEILSLISILPFVAIVMSPSMIHTSKSMSFVFRYFQFSSSRNFMLFVGVVVLVLFVVSSCFLTLIDYILMKTSCYIQHRMSDSLLEKLLSQSYAYYFNNNTSECIKNLTTDVDVIRDNLVIAFFNLISKLITCLLIVLTLLILKPLVALTVLFTFGASYVLCYFLVKNRQFNNSLEAHQNRSTRYSLIKDLFSCIHEIKIFQKEGFFHNKHNYYSEQYMKLMTSDLVISKLPKSILELLSFGTVIGILIVMVYLNTAASVIITSLCLFAVAGYRLAPYINQIYVALMGIKFTEKTFTDYQSMLDNLRILDFGENKVNSDDTFNSSIQYIGLVFSYADDSQPLIKKVSIEIKKNSTTAFVGPSGGGKSTIVNLLCGQLIPREVSLRIDGEYCEYNPRNLGRLFGYVPQKVSLLNGSVYSNIAFGVDEDKIDKVRARDVAILASIDDVILNLEHSYETSIGEGGIKLSGGQRQRLGIARALYNDPEILIFDEATSSLDYHTENEIMRAINLIAKSKTVILIAHRLSTVKNCDVVHFIADGTITASGAYDELLSNTSSFREMVEMEN